MKKNTETTYLAVGHCRVSKGTNEEIQNSIDSQKTEVIKIASSLDISKEQILWNIEEEARSAYSEKADWSAFDKIINEACQIPSIKYFITFSQERFCRNKARSQHYKSLLQAHNVEIHYATGSVDPNENTASYLMDSMMETNAELYSRKIAEDTLRGSKQNALTRDKKTGYAYQNGGTPPFWLKAQKNTIGQNDKGNDITKTIWIKNDEIFTATIDGEVVSKTMWNWGRYIFRNLRLKKGLSYREIADFLNEIKFPAARKSSLVRQNTLSLQAKNECLYGLSIYNKRRYINHLNKVSTNPKEKWVMVKDGMPALITEEEYDLLQKMSEVKKRKEGGTSSNTTNTKLLLDMPEKFTCTSCGHKIISSGKHYVCSEYNSHGKKGCKASSFYVKSDWLDTQIEKEISRTILNDKTITELYNGYIIALHKQAVTLADSKENDMLNKSLNKRLQSVKKEQENLLRALEQTSSNEASQAIILSRLEKKVEEIKEIEESLKQINKNSKQSDKRILTLDYFKQLCVEGSNILKHGSLVEKRSFINDCIEYIHLDPVRREVEISMNLSPFTIATTSSEHNKIGSSPKETSNEMVAGAGFEPTTFGL